MTTLYKLTDGNATTFGGMRWSPGTTNSLEHRPSSPSLCSGDVLHAYRDDTLALLLNANGAKFQPPRLWRAEGKIVCYDYGKVGCFELKIIEEMELPGWYTDERMRRRVMVAFAVLCAESVLDIFQKRRPRDERPRKAIEAARAYLAGKPAAASAAYAAADAARAAAYAAARAADAAADAAYAAADAAAYADAAYAAAAPDFAELALRAVRMAA